MSSNKILYYPYINIPNTLWTSRALLYWDNIGVIVPEDYINNPENLDAFMLNLVSAELVEQIIPIHFTQNLENFKKGFLDIILQEKFRIMQKRKAFIKGEFVRIHVEKFDNGLMHILEELGLAKWDNWPWWNVEPETAKMLMTYLATIIAIKDNRSPVTDEVSKKPKKIFPIRNDPKMELRNRLLNDVLPLPTKIDINDLEKIKANYSQELIRFRRLIEKTIIDLSKHKNSKDFEADYKIHLDDLKDTKAYIADKLKRPGFGKIVFGTICSLSATGIAVAQTPKEQLLFTIPSILTAVYTAIGSYNQNDTRRQEPLSYLALIDKQLKQ